MTATKFDWVRRGTPSAWVTRATTSTDPPPDPTSNTAIHVPNRVIYGFANADGGNSQLTYADAISFTGAIYERRKFSTGWVTASFINTWLDTTSAAGQTAWLSFKVPSNDWAGVTAGNYNSDLDIIKARAAARSEKWLVSVHHEPAGDGDLGVWANMQKYISNYLAPVNDKVTFAPIGNGFWFGPKQWDPASFNAAFPSSLLTALNTNRHLLAVDSYDSADPSQLSYTQYDRTSLKMQGFIDWARAQGVKAVGFGEHGCHTGEDVRRCWNVLAANCDLVEVANYFNSGANSRANWLLVPANYKAPNAAFNGTAESAAKLAQFVAAKALSVNANPGQLP